MIRHPDQRVGVFIDTQNMYYSARHLHNRKVDFEKIVTDAVGDRRLFRQIAYVVTTKSEHEKPFLEALQKIGIELREKELKEYYSGQKKADWDVGLTVDVIRMLDMLDVVVIVSGDGDYLPLVAYCKGRGRIVEVMGFRETTATRLVEEADAFINLSDESGKYLIGNAPTKRGKRSGKSSNKGKSNGKRNNNKSKNKNNNNRSSRGKAQRGQRTESKPPETDESFFMERPQENKEDPQEMRKRRLTF